MNRRLKGLVIFLLSAYLSPAQSYPHNYFRHPLDIPMQLVANFGEIRTNHWHMGLDIRTQHHVNLPVHAAADGYIARVSVEPGGFGQAVYINHPNGYTTVYGHLNSFFPALADYVKERQYQLQSWNVSLVLPPGLFPVRKGDVIALSGSTGASEGPHVHFEIRDTRTDNCLNPLLFSFPVADAVPPSILRLALYDRNRSTWEQSPQLLPLRKMGSVYTVAGSVITVASDRISFAVGAVDHFTGSANPNGIYSAKLTMDGRPVSEFALDDISYNDTRYINAQLDYPYKSRGGGALQHITPLPGAKDVVYRLADDDGVIRLRDGDPHVITIEVSDASGNTSTVRFSVRYDQARKKIYAPSVQERFLPGNVNIFERPDFELFTTERTMYDTITTQYSETEAPAADAISPLCQFLSAAIPAHDSVTVRIRPSRDLAEDEKERVVIRNRSGSKTFVAKADLQKGWYAARFRQFGTYQAFVDKEPPTINNPPSRLVKGGRIVFVPHDNFHTIRSFRAELDGHWLRFSNDKGEAWIYTADEHFPEGSHQLTVRVEDEAGNVTTRAFTVTR